jgi:hypothetical protein
MALSSILKSEKLVARMIVFFGLGILIVDFVSWVTLKKYMSPVSFTVASDTGFATLGSGIFYVFRVRSHVRRFNENKLTPISSDHPISIGILAGTLVLFYCWSVIIFFAFRSKFNILELSSILTLICIFLQLGLQAIFEWIAILRWRTLQLMNPKDSKV